ncbi:MAG TPA: host attachment protein [Myxococcaceae bacterium]|nr:host attachment protein [Myxococcaceae bacterium]
MERDPRQWRTTPGRRTWIILANAHFGRLYRTDGHSIDWAVEQEWKNPNTEELVAAIAGHLDRNQRLSSFQALMVVAPEPLLTALTGAFSEPVKQALEATVDRDLTTLETSAVARTVEGHP